MPEEFQLIFVSDFLKVPLCLLLLYVIAFRVRVKYKGTEIEKYFIAGLTFRIMFTVFYTLIIGYYYKGGDTGMFYQALKDMQKAVEDDSSFLKEIYFNAKLDPDSSLTSYFMYDGFGVIHYYMFQVSNYMVPKFALPFSIIFSKSYLCISFCMTFFAFAGSWRLFKLFYSFFPHLHKKIAIATMFIPSVLFWSGALMKDSICMGALGFFIYAFHQLFFKKKKILINLIIVASSGILLFYVKPYIILCALPAFLVWAFLLLNRNIKDKGFRMFATLIFTIATVAGSLYFMQSIASSELASQYATQNIVKALESQQNTYSLTESAGSSFNVGKVGDSPLSIIMLFPGGVVTSLFRPFLWEVRSPVMLLTALEALAFMFLTVQCFRYTSFKKFKQIMGQNPVLIFCFIYAILFAGLVGISTLNFGTLARYKIPALPFFVVLLFVILDKVGKASPDVILHKKLF